MKMSNMEERIPDIITNMNTYAVKPLTIAIESWGRGGFFKEFAGLKGVSFYYVE